ncbi:MAG: serine--tRNA ligase, partial [bacterium]
MHDPKLIRENPGLFKESLRKRGMDDSLVDEFLALDERRRKLLQETQSLREKQNKTSKEISQLKREKKEIPQPLLSEMRVVSDVLKEKLEEQRKLEERWKEILLSIPNLPHSSVPEGLTEDENIEVRRWGDIRDFPFPAKPHWEIGTKLGLFDLEKAAEIAGSRFPLFLS